MLKRFRLQIEPQKRFVQSIHFSHTLELKLVFLYMKIDSNPSFVRTIFFKTYSPFSCLGYNLQQ